MNMMEGYLAELEMESQSTRALLEAAPEAKYGWRPHEKGMSLGQLCGHIAGAGAQMTQILGGDGFDINDRPEPNEGPATRAELLKMHDEAYAATKDWLSSLGPRAGEMWSLKKGDQEIMAMPRAVAIRSFLFNHTYHHRGQLSTYLRSIGEAVPSVYGPTADVDPFA